VPADEPSDRVVKRLRDENPVTSRIVEFKTSRDPVLAKVVRHVRFGWPAKLTQVSEEIKPFFPHRSEYTIENGTLMWSIRVVIPKSLQPQILQLLHETHPGVVRMKSLARQYVWWPGVDADIESTVKSCVSSVV
jgi:hypothetical protein